MSKLLAIAVASLLLGGGVFAQGALAKDSSAQNSLTAPAVPVFQSDNGDGGGNGGPPPDAGPLDGP